MKERGFPKGYGPILLGMEEPTFRRIDAAAGNGGRRSIPTHAPVDVPKSIALAMAGQLGIRSQIPPTTSVLRNLVNDGHYMGRPLGGVAAANKKVQLVVPQLKNVAATQFEAWIGDVDTDTFLKAIDGIKWITSDYYAPDKQFLHEIAGAVRKWIVIVLQTGVAKNRRDLPGAGERIIVERGPKPPSNKLWGEPTDRKHRPAAQFLAGSLPDYGDPVLNAWKGPNVGAVLVYPMAPNPAQLPVNPAPKELVLGVAWITPAHLRGSTSQVVQFRAKKSELVDEPIVPVD